MHRLVLLREVHLRGSITAAARALSYTHSAVSQHIALLEKEVGVPLLERVGRGVRLTPAAERLVVHTDRILTTIECAEADLMTSDTAVRGTLRLAAFTTISRTVVPAVIAGLSDRHPDLEIRFRQVEPEDGLLLLSSRQVDVLVADSYPGTSPGVPSDLHADLLMEDPIRAYLPTGASVSSLEDLRSLRWVVEPAGSEARAWATRICLQHGFEPQIAFESADLLFHLRMVQAGLAAAFLPDLLVRAEGATVEEAALLGVQHRQISMFCRAGAEQRPDVAACRDAFADYLREESF